jgi:hypothetical protein
LPVADELEKRMQAIRNRAIQTNRQEEQVVIARAMPGTGPLAAPDLFERNTDEDLQLFADPFVAAPIEPVRSRGQRSDAYEETGLPARTTATSNQPGEWGFAADGRRQGKPSQIVESTLVKTSSPAHTGRSPSGSLWSYSSPLPAVKINSTGSPGTPASNTPSEASGQRGRKSQFKAPLPSPGSGKQRPPDAYPSSSLWAYGEKKRAKGH